MRDEKTIVPPLRITSPANIVWKKSVHPPNDEGMVAVMYTAVVTDNFCLVLSSPWLQPDEVNNSSEPILYLVVASFPGWAYKADHPYPLHEAKQQAIKVGAQMAAAIQDDMQQLAAALSITIPGLD